MVDELRYLLALLTVVSVPPAILFWFVIHPFARYWRSVGAVPTYAVSLSVFAGLAAVLFLARRPLLAVEFGFVPWLAVLGGLAYLGAAMIEVRCRRHLKLAILAGVPEVSRTGTPGKLLTEGIYGRLRHPRYVGVTLGLLAVALVTNYLACYVLLALSLPALWLVVELEERELAERFGPAWTSYSREVPRFVPRSRGSYRIRQPPLVSGFRLCAEGRGKAAHTGPHHGG